MLKTLNKIGKKLEEHNKEQLAKCLAENDSYKNKIKTYENFWPKIFKTYFPEVYSWYNEL